MPKPTIRPTVKRVNAVCRTCSRHPHATHPAGCPDGAWCVREGPHAWARAERLKSKRVTGDQGVRKRIRYNEEGERID